MIVDRLTMAFIQREQPDCGWRVGFDNGLGWYRCMSCILVMVDEPRLSAFTLTRSEPMDLHIGGSRCARCGVRLQQYVGDLPCR